jgi:chromosomal replication initiator protein
VGGLNKLIAFAQLTGQQVSLQLAEEQLTDILSANRRRITIDEIQRTVCQFYRVDRSEMASKRRARAVVRPRQVAMYLAKVLTPGPIRKSAASLAGATTPPSSTPCA